LVPVHLTGLIHPEVPLDPVAGLEGPLAVPHLPLLNVSGNLSSGPLAIRPDRPRFEVFLRLYGLTIGFFFRLMLSGFDTIPAFTPVPSPHALGLSRSGDQERYGA
jgi:hypothetical protein